VNQGRDEQRVWLFTNNDNPAPDDARLQGLLQIGKDASRMGVNLSLWHMDKPPHASLSSSTTTSTTPTTPTTAAVASVATDDAATEAPASITPAGAEWRTFDLDRFYGSFLKLLLAERHAALTRAAQLAGKTMSKTYTNSRLDEDEDEDDADDDDLSEQAEAHVAGCGRGGFDLLFAAVRSREHSKRRMAHLLMTLPTTAARTVGHCYGPGGGHPRHSSSRSSGTTEQPNSNSNSNPPKSEPESEPEPEFEPDPVILGMSLYKLLSPAVLPSYVWLSEESQQPLKIETRFLNTEDGRIVAREELGSAVRFETGPTVTATTTAATRTSHEWLPLSAGRKMQLLALHDSDYTLPAPLRARPGEKDPKTGNLKVASLSLRPFVQYFRSKNNTILFSLSLTRPLTSVQKPNND
jgi:hypothetical protein